MRGLLTTGDGLAVQLRAYSASDEPFLHRLYADRRGPELEPLGWTVDQRAAFVDHQFRAQQAGYGSSFPTADHWILVVDDKAVGRLLVDRRPQEDLVVDMVIMSEWRGRGIGTALMAEVLADAGRAGVPVRLTVVVNEPHLVRWYGRLGFSVVETDDVHLRMACPPVPAIAEGP